MKPTKENTLYLTIKQVYFDAIANGTKKEEYRQIKTTTYKKYLECDPEGNPYYDGDLMSPDYPLAGEISVWNGGVYPYVPKQSIKYLNLAVGYAKERDTMIVEVTGITFEPEADEQGKLLRFTVNNGNIKRSDKGELCAWIAVFHLGKIVEINRK